MSLTDWPNDEPAPPSAGFSISGTSVSMPPLLDLVRRWNEIEPLLRRATQRTLCYEPIDLLFMAATGQGFIWLCMRGEEIDAAIATQVTLYPRRKVYEVLFGGGNNMRRWVSALVDACDRHAEQLGCSHVACAGRPGWVRAWGARATGDIIMVRELT